MFAFFVIAQNLLLCMRSGFKLKNEELRSEKDIFSRIELYIVQISIYTHNLNGSF